MDNYIFIKMSNEDIINCLDKCTICIIGTCDNNLSYMTPVFFDYHKINNAITFIIESKNTGRKIKNIASNEYVSIFIQYNDHNSYQTIFSEGKASLINYENYEKSNMLTIEINVNKIEGRIYYK